MVGSVYEAVDAQAVELFETVESAPSSCGFCAIDPGESWEVVGLTWVPCEGEVIDGVCYQSGCRVDCFVEQECLYYSIADCTQE